MKSTRKRRKAKHRNDQMFNIKVTGTQTFINSFGTRRRLPMEILNTYLIDLENRSTSMTKESDSIIFIFDDIPYEKEYYKVYDKDSNNHLFVYYKIPLQYETENLIEIDSFKMIYKNLKQFNNLVTKKKSLDFMSKNIFNKDSPNQHVIIDLKKDRDIVSLLTRGRLPNINYLYEISNRQSKEKEDVYKYKGKKYCEYDIRTIGDLKIIDPSDRETRLYIPKYNISYKVNRGNWVDLGNFDGPKDNESYCIHELNIRCRYLRIKPMCNPQNGEDLRFSILVPYEKEDITNKVVVQIDPKK